MNAQQLIALVALLFAVLSVFVPAVPLAVAVILVAMAVLWP
jgi:hypothetical protein